MKSRFSSVKRAVLSMLCMIMAEAALVTGCSTTQERDMIDRSVVEDVDLERYAGVWYEIARFPHRFEKDLVGVTATYTLREDGKIGVLNQGYKGSFEGKLKKAKAKAKVPDPAQPGRLKVYFFPLVGAEYNIMVLDEEYRYALVGSSTPNFLWILSRTSRIDEATYEMLVEEARRRGYDVSMLQKVPQR
jgi:apolipoprotein D and lipocalin family protein